MPGTTPQICDHNNPLRQVTTPLRVGSWGWRALQARPCSAAWLLWTAGGVTSRLALSPPPCLRITCQQWLLGCSQLLPRKSVRSWGLLLLWWPSFKRLHFIIYEMKTVVCSRCCWRALLARSLQESQSPLIILKMSTAWKVMEALGVNKKVRKSTCQI